MTADDSINEDLPTISEDLVVTKYKMAAEIANSESHVHYHAAPITILS